MGLTIPLSKQHRGGRRGSVRRRLVGRDPGRPAALADREAVLAMQDPQHQAGGTGLSVGMSGRHSACGDSHISWAYSVPHRTQRNPRMNPARPCVRTGEGLQGAVELSNPDSHPFSFVSTGREGRFNWGGRGGTRKSFSVSPCWSRRIDFE